MTATTSTTTPAWRLPAVVITCACLFSLLSFGVRAGLGLFLEPMTTEFGWGREVFALAIAVQNVLWGLAVPFAGALADRLGPARVLMVGGLLYGLGLALMAFSTTPALLHLSAGILIGLGLAGASFSIVLAALSQMVRPERRSLVLGLGTAAGSMGQFLMVPTAQTFLAAFGWSDALLLLSLFGFALIPLALPLGGRVATAAGAFQQTLGQAVREASGHSGFLLLTAGFFVCGFHVAFIQTHLPAYVTDVGLAGGVAAWALALVGLFNVIGSLLAGLLGGRYSKKYLLSAIYLARAVAITVFVLAPPSEIGVLIFAAVMGLLWLSTVPLTSGLVAQIFGPRYMATLFGIVFFSHQVGAFLGVWLGGRLFDATGSYDVVWWISVGLGLVAALVHWPINDRQVTRLASAR